MKNAQSAGGREAPFVIERILNAPAEKVWQAITDKDQMKQWYFDLEVFRPEAGFEFSFYAGPDEKQWLHECKVLEVIPGKKLKYSWRYAGYEGVSFVTWELFADGNKTRLKLTHEGLDTFPADVPELGKENFAIGWQQIIGASLKNYLEATADSNPPCAEAQMLIRKPAAQVFEAFVDPGITANFWFTKGSGRLEVNKNVTWEWEMYGVSARVVAKVILPGEKILFEWNEPARMVEFTFKPYKGDATLVKVTEWGFDKQGDELIAAIRDSTGGFTTVLDGLKAFLEHGIHLNLIADKFPPQK
ncbi:SRPBCC domain-containing protein [Compostibacter hankyongensis]|uniref:Activator of Hsp90 ATPase homologue 1/2-like C-terminal domain-containing protein n=1 Tax=Compostibacter hankyongensis TaxID=1007089 RepID=A0ABP8FCV6_9BACT